MAQDLREWWAGLDPDDQVLFVQLRNHSPVPGRIVTRFVRTGRLIAGAKWESSDQDDQFEWPERVKKFLDERYNENPAAYPAVGGL